MTKPQSLPQQIEGDYCCVTGYVEVCRARGQGAASCAEHLGLPARTVQDYFRAVDNGTRSCRRLPDCMRPLCLEIHQAYLRDKAKKKDLE